MVNWPSVFDEATPVRGASDAEIEWLVATIGQSLSPAEIDEINEGQLNPFSEGNSLHAAYQPFDPSLWTMPARPLPESFLSLLRWTNGGWSRSGEREFQWFPTGDPTGGLRAMALAYHVPEYMPGALPFAFNGGGTFYLFDMRQDAIAGEYPIGCAHAGNLGWESDQWWPVADTFEAACRGTISVDDLRWDSEETDDSQEP